MRLCVGVLTRPCAPPLAGEWLPAATLDAFRKHLVGIKGPLTTPVGGGIRSLNVALRQELDLFVCLRPVRWFTGVPSPVKRPELVRLQLRGRPCVDSDCRRPLPPPARSAPRRLTWSSSARTARTSTRVSSRAGGPS